MRGEKPKGKRVRKRTSVRATISFPRDAYESLDEIAKQKKVSLAWVVREAVAKYIADKWPLFRREQAGA
jgi:predicted DNA-binding protein